MSPSDLRRIAHEEYSDIVVSVRNMGRRSAATLKLRLDIRDGTFVDVWFNQAMTRYSFHWEQRAQRGQLHRHDNAPDHPHISTFPKHFHDGSESNIMESHIPDLPDAALRFFLDFVRHELESPAK